MDRVNKLKEFLINDPDDAFVKHALALEYIKAGDDETAEILFNEILNANPAYVGSYYHLAKVQERRAAYTEAEATYKKGIEQCKIAGDKHAQNELQMALDEISDE